MDRDTNIAHHIWTCYPDGRDPRSPHGNYPQQREARPWMEMDIRAIPNSQQFVAVTGAHHGNAFGSLVMIDPGVIDDTAMSQLTRITPDTPFPEAEGGHAEHQQVFAVRDALAAERRGLLVRVRRGGEESRHLLDRSVWQSTVALSRSGDLLPQPHSVATPTAATRASRPDRADGRRGGAEPAPPSATISVVSVYDSDFEWPADARVVGSADRAGASEDHATSERPAHRRRRTDERPSGAWGPCRWKPMGARTSRRRRARRSTFRLWTTRAWRSSRCGAAPTCIPANSSPARAATNGGGRAPTAVRSAPGHAPRSVENRSGPRRLQPVQLRRLVQDVLDRNCVECHRTQGALDLTGVVEGPHGWTRSYNNLATKYGFYFHVTNGAIRTGVHGGARTIAGQFGARAAGLLEYLSEKHYGVKLSGEDLHRITLWLDCNSEFFGAYENTAAQSLGQLVPPSLD